MCSVAKLGGGGCTRTRADSAPGLATYWLVTSDKSPRASASEPSCEDRCPLLSSHSPCSLGCVRPGGHLCPTWPCPRLALLQQLALILTDAASLGLRCGCCAAPAPGKPPPHPAPAAFGGQVRKRHLWLQEKPLASQAPGPGRCDSPEGLRPAGQRAQGPGRSCGRRRRSGFRVQRSNLCSRKT